MRRLLLLCLPLALVSLLIAACYPPAGPAGPVNATTPIATPADSRGPVTRPPAPAGEQVITGLASVASVDALVLESFPVQVHAIAQGNLPDGCTEIDQTLQQRTGNVFEVVLTTKRPADAMCTMAIEPFEETIPLDVLGLPAGDYTVTVNGIGDTFTLAVDNKLP